MYVEGAPVFEMGEVKGKLKRGLGTSMALRARSHGDRDTPAATDGAAAVPTTVLLPRPPLQTHRVTFISSRNKKTL